MLFNSPMTCLFAVGVGARERVPPSPRHCTGTARQQYHALNNSENNYEYNFFHKNLDYDVTFLFPQVLIPLRVNSPTVCRTNRQMYETFDPILLLYRQSACQCLLFYK